MLPHKALDLFCGAGGATRGMQRAGFHVTGVDVKPQPRYVGDAFIQADALSVSLDGYDFVWSSPPCQAHTVLKKMWNAKAHIDLIPQTRAKFKAWGGPYIIENVVGAPLIRPVLLCGTMFNLGTGDAELRRHRLFESNCFLLAPECRHGQRKASIGVYGGHLRNRKRTIGIYGEGVRDSRMKQARTIGVYGKAVRDRGLEGRLVADRNPDQGCADWGVQEGREAMDVDWMSLTELCQAIPPAYSEFLCQQIVEQLERRAA